MIGTMLGTALGTTLGTTLGKRFTIATLVSCALALLGERPAVAHQFRPVLLHLSERAPGVFAVSFTRDVGPGARHLAVQLPTRCQRVSAPKEHIERAVRVTRFTVECDRERLVGARIGIEGLAASERSAFVDINFYSGGRFRATLYGARTNAVVTSDHRTAGAGNSASGRDRLASAWQYIRLGVWHIAIGADHLLFVLALLLLVGVRARRLLATISAFTAGHSLTLALTTLGAISLAPAPLEVLIALSIVWLGLELTRPVDERSALSAHPWLVAFAFGLLHGFGFAGALGAIGLPHSDIVPALIGFNVGVEVGQLAFVSACLIARVVARPLLTRLPVVVRSQVPAYALGGLACYFTLDRIAALWRGG